MQLKFNTTTFKDTTVSLENLTRDEAATVYFALTHYRDDLVKDIAKAQERNRTRKDVLLGFEDHLFLGEQLNKVGEVLYQLMANHEHSDNPAFARWLDVI